MKLKRRSTSEFIAIDSRAPIVTGEEACIYPVTGSQEFYARVWRADANDYIRHLIAMIDHPLPGSGLVAGHVAIAWPVDLVYTEDMRDCAGYLMPCFGPTRALPDIYSPAARRRESPYFSYRYLYRAARNLAGAVGTIHAGGYVIGDLSDANVRVADTALITLLGTEHFRAAGGRSNAPKRNHDSRPEYTPPELQNLAIDTLDRRAQHDNFALAVMIFQLLMEGHHPFSGVQTGNGAALTYSGRIQAGYFAYGPNRGPYTPRSTSPPFELLPQGLREMFLRCFDEGHHSPENRPTAPEWADALQAVEADMQICQSNAQHVFPGDSTSCPWCARAREIDGSDSFPPRGVAVGEPTGAGPTEGHAASAATPQQPASRPTSARSARASAGANPGRTDGATPVINAAASTAIGPSATQAAGQPALGRSRWRPLVAAVALLLVVFVAFGDGYLRRLSAVRQADANATGAARADLDKAAQLVGVAGTDFQHADMYDAAQAQCDRATAELARVSKGGRSAPLYITTRDRVSRLSVEISALTVTAQADEALDHVTHAITENMHRTLTAQQANALKSSLGAECAQAEAYCTQALAIDPNCEPAWIERIRGYSLMGDNKAADQAAQTATAIFPDHAADFRNEL